MQRTLALSTALALTLAVGVVAPRPASASAFSKEPGKISVHIANKSEETQSVKVDGHVYTVQPHASVALKVPEGSIVYAAGNSSLHQDGEKLITITPDMKDGTLNLEPKSGA